MKATRASALGAMACLALACMRAPPWHAVSPDRSARVTVTQRGGRTCVAVTARPERCHDAVNLAAMAFASRGASIAYAAREGDGWVVVHDGRAGTRWRGVGAPILSADGTRLAYAASDDEAWRVVVDGRPGPAFPAILEGSLLFDPTGRRIAYAARRGDSSLVVVDGVAQRGWGGVGRITFSTDGAHVAYVASLDGRATPVVDGIARAKHDAVGDMVFSRSGHRFAYAARDAAGWAVHGEPGPSAAFDTVRALALRERGDTPSPVFVARRSAREAVVVDGVARRWHARITSAAVAGSRWGYIADGASVFVDGDSLATEKDAWDLVASRDGARWAWLAEQGDGVVVAHDGERTRFDFVVDGTLQFLDDAPVWTCLAGDRERRELFVVVDGRRTQRRLDWGETVRATRRHDRQAHAFLREWVAAEARLALREGAAR